MSVNYDKQISLLLWKGSGCRVCKWVKCSIKKTLNIAGREPGTTLASARAIIRVGEKIGRLACTGCVYTCAHTAVIEKHWQPKVALKRH